MGKVQLSGFWYDFNEWKRKHPGRLIAENATIILCAQQASLDKVVWVCEIKDGKGKTIAKHETEELTFFDPDIMVLPKHPIIYPPSTKEIVKRLEYPEQEKAETRDRYQIMARYDLEPARCIAPEPHEIGRILQCSKPSTSPRYIWTVA